MAKKKDFANIDTSRVYGAIADATAEPEQEAQEVQEEQETPRKRKPNREYTEAERQEFMRGLKTSGRKGVKLPRINFAFAPDVYEYVQIMSRVRGESMTEFVNNALRQHMNEHTDIFNKAKEFRNSL